MHVVILGAGSVGFQLARQLIEEDKNVALIEKDPEKAKQAANLLDCLVVNEAGNNPEALKRSGIQRADYFIAVTESDEINMIACGMAASQAHVPNKIARVRNIDYSNNRTLQQPFLGIDFIVNPEIEAARAITSTIERGAVSDIMFFQKTGLQMRTITVGSRSPFANRSIEQIKRSVEANFLVAVILRESHFLIPSGNVVVRENDKLYLIATEEDFDHLFARAGKGRMRLSRIVLVGGGAIGTYVAEHLLGEVRWGIPLFDRLRRYLGPGSTRKLTIIDGDYGRCKQLAERFPSALVLNADISDEEFSEQEQFSDADLVIATTGNQELNLVNAVYAKVLGAKRSVALVNKSSYLQVASSLGIDVPVSPVDSTVNSILRYIRKGNVGAVHSISGGKVEVMELSVERGSRIANRPISKIRLPEQTLIVSVTRDSENIIPSGDLSLQSGDDLIVIAKKDSVPKVEALFAE